MSKHIRKQVYDLTTEDFAVSSVWEFADDEENEPNQDEATVRPHCFFEAVDPSCGILIVETKYTLADGTKFPGYLTPSEHDRSFGTLQPQIITQNGQVTFWYGCCPLDLNREYDLLGRDAASVFPIYFETNVPLLCGPISGTIQGFMSLKDDFETVVVVR